MSNILRPNFFGIETAATPEWVVSSGMVAKVTDASGDQTIVIAQGGKLDLDGALGANLIVLQGLSSTQVSVYRSGTEARFKLLSTGETFLSLPSTSTAQALRFTDGDKSLQIVSGAPRFAGTNISTEAAAPGLSSVGVVGSELQLSFNEEMSGGSLPLASAFQIVVNGVTLTSTDYTVAGAEGETVRINLPASAATAATISVSYTDPTSGNDGRALQDINGNDAASFGPLTAVRSPADVRAPMLLAAATSTDGSKITLEFNEDLAGGSLAASRFAVTVAGNGVGVTSVSVQSRFVELSLSSGSIAAGQAVQLSYTGAGGSADAVRDAAGNAVATWAAWNVSNEVLGAAPVLAKATNILKPNLYGIETAQTPNWKVSAGMVAKVTDASGNQVITVARGGKLDLDGAVGSNVIVLEGRISGEVEVYRSGTEVRFRLLESGETILSMPATSTAQTVRFVNGDKILQIVSGSPRFDGVAVATDSTAPVHDRATIAGTDLRVFFSEELDGAKLPAASTLTITVNGQVLTASQFTIQGVEGRQLVVALAQAVAEGAVVTVAYADPTTGNDALALQDINGNDAASFGPIQAVEPVKKVLLDDQVPAGGPGNPVSLTVSSQAFHLMEDFARTSNFEIVGFGADDKIELTNLQTPAALSISTIESDVEVIVNAGEGVTSALLIKGVVPNGVTVYNPATFNDLAVGDLIGIDATRPVFTGGASRAVSVVEGQTQLVTVTATDASAVSYTLSGADAALLQVSAGGGAVSLKSGVLDYDAAGAKRSYSFDVVGIDAFGNDRVQAVTVNVTNDPADDGPPPDTTPPALQSATVTPNGLAMTLTFSEALDIANFTPSQLVQRFAVGVGNNNAWPVESVSIAGSVVTLNILPSQPIPNAPSLGGGVVLVSYNDLSSVNDPSNVLQDLAGNDLGSVSGVTVTNSSTYVPPTAVTIQSLNAGALVAEGASIIYTVTLSGPAPAAGYTVDWRVVQHITGNPAQGADFGVTSAGTNFPLGSVFIPAGQTSGQITLSVFNDPLSEIDEVFALEVGRAGATAGQPFVSAFSHVTVIAASDTSIGPDPTAPMNSGITSFTTPTTGTSDILVRFSEPIFEVNAGAQISGFSLVRNPTSANDFKGSGTAPLITGFTLGEGDATGGYKLLTLRTDTVFNADDVVRVGIDGNGNGFRDADGNKLAGQDVYVGGDGNNTVDLNKHRSSARQILRGNAGNDTLTGTDNADTLVDGSGADMLRGGHGGDFYGMVENGTTRAYARDTVAIGLAEARLGYTFDLIRWDGTDNNSGFDWFSSTASNHDVLALPAGLVVVDTPAPGSTVASGFAATVVPQGALAGHTVSGGIVTFKDSAGAPIAIAQATNLGNALDYLRANLQSAGRTVAFKLDHNNDGSAESLIVYQDAGMVPLAGSAELPDTVVRIEQALATRLDGVTLGSAAGANVLQIVDGVDPNPIAIGLASSGVVLNFAEPVFAPATVANLAISLQVNGAGTVYTPANVQGDGTSALLVQCAGLASAQLALGVTDWALITYAGTDAGNALRDASGRLLIPDSDNSVPQAHIFVQGSSGNNVIDLSARAVTGGGLDIEAAGGDDVVKGTVGDDQIRGDAGSDSMSGGQGADTYGFAQGDSPTLTFNLNGASATALTGATYSFAGGKAEVITDFSTGDKIKLSPPLDGLTGAAWLNGLSSASEIGTNGGLAPDQRFFAVQGSLNAANGVFTVGTNGTAGPDTLVVYDGDGSSGVSQTGFVLQGVALSQLGGLYQSGNEIWSNVQPASATTKIDWTAEQNGPGIVQGDAIAVQVHFTNPVVVSGAPSLGLVITNDAGQSRTVQAAFAPYSDVPVGGSQTSVLFKYALNASDKGQYHIDSISLNGGSIVEQGPGGLAADLTLDSSNRTITAGTYLYGAPVLGLTGTGGNDALLPYETNPASAPTNGVFTGVDGGAGDLDALVIPVLLPVGVTSMAAASGYTLKYNPGSATSNPPVSPTVTAVSSDGTVAATVTVAFPTGVEVLYFHAVYRDGTGAYEDAELSAVTLSKNLVTVNDAVVGAEHFVQGTPGADTINVSTDTNADSRYLIRGGPGNDAITGSAGRDAIRGDGGSNTINAGGGNDAIFVGGGSDVVDGGVGTDKVVATLPGQMLAIGSRISGFALQSQTGTWGTNGFTLGSTSNVYRIQTDDSGALYVRNFSDGSLAMSATNVEALEVRLNQSDMRSVIPLILGAADAIGDTLSGTGMSIVSGRAGNDTLNASNNGNDVLVGGSGNDTLNGGASRDLMYGGSGDDSMTGQAGNDWFVGDSGNDVLNGGDGNDAAGFVVANSTTSTEPLSFAWDDPTQSLLVKQGSVSLARISQGQNGAMVVQDLAVSTVPSHFGTDTLTGVESLTFDFANGTTSVSPRTVIFGSGGPDSLSGSGGSDLMLGNGGDDTLRGGAGDDTLDGFNGVDTAQFTGPYANYQVVIANGMVTITDGVANRDGVDRVVNVERFLFSDGEYKVSGSGTGIAALNAQAAEVLNRTQGSGYTDAVDASTFQFTDSNMGDWIDGFPPLLISQVATRTLATIAGDLDDNELKYGTEFTAGAVGTPGTTQVFFRYDMNAAVGQVQPSDLIELSFLGDVRSSLVPESLTYSG